MRRIDMVDDVGGHHNLAFVLLAQGKAQEAFDIFDRFTSIEQYWLVSRGLALHDLGRHEQVAEMLRRLVKDYGDTEAGNIAALYAYGGDSASAIAWLEKMIEENQDEFDDVVWDSRFSSLHDTPQWLRWRKEAGLDEETLATIEFHIPDFGT